MQPRPPPDLPDRQPLNQPHPTDLRPLLHADHPILPASIDDDQARLKTQPDSTTRHPGGSVFNRRRWSSIQPAPTFSRRFAGVASRESPPNGEESLKSGPARHDRFRPRACGRGVIAKATQQSSGSSPICAPADDRVRPAGGVRIDASETLRWTSSRSRVAPRRTPPSQRRSGSRGNPRLRVRCGTRPTQRSAVRPTAASTQASGSRPIQDPVECLLSPLTTHRQQAPHDRQSRGRHPQRVRFRGSSGRRHRPP